jgi:hypothetical protein
MKFKILENNSNWRNRIQTTVTECIEIHNFHRKGSVKLSDKHRYSHYAMQAVTGIATDINTRSYTIPTDTRHTTRAKVGTEFDIMIS